MAQSEVKNGVAAEATAPVVSFTAMKPQFLVEAPKADDAVKFYKAAFGAEEVRRACDTKRKAEQDQPFIRYAELKLAGVTILVSDYSHSEKSAGSNGVILCLETENVEAAIAKAVAAGGVAEGEITEGESACCDGLVGKVKDPYGFVWVICSSASQCDEAET